MWHWDQGHLAYFQFDALREIAVFIETQDFKTATRGELEAATGLAFAAPIDYSPWRQYSRVLKLCLLVSEVNDVAVPTPVAKILSVPGTVTCDEYLHFLIRAFTEPSPALQDWQPNVESRYPLLFTLKYLLAKRAIAHSPVSTLDEVVGAYRMTGFVGDETDAEFIGIIGSHQKYGQAGNNAPGNLRRQARESIQVIAQISYLHLEGSNLIVSLDPVDAQAIFADLHPVTGPKAVDRESELGRLANLFKDGANEDFFDYPNTVVNDVVQSGFVEGSKVKKTHITIERNQELRKAFFYARPTAVCDVCSLDTAATYPWTERVLDLHHLLPLSSGTRVESSGTTFDDLVPVCPSCHRAVHRFYDRWLNESGLADFPNEHQARAAYKDVKTTFGGVVHA
ncbi:MAG: HNH endonuclease [Acidobacteriaceae bacterium]